MCGAAVEHEAQKGRGSGSGGQGRVRGGAQAAGVGPQGGGGPDIGRFPRLSVRFIATFISTSISTSVDVWPIAKQGVSDKSLCTSFATFTKGIRGW